MPQPKQPTANFLFQGESRLADKTPWGPSTGKKLWENRPIDSCDKQRTGKKSEQKRADVWSDTGQQSTRRGGDNNCAIPLVFSRLRQRAVLPCSERHARSGNSALATQPCLLQPLLPWVFPSPGNRAQTQLYYYYCWKCVLVLIYYVYRVATAEHQKKYVSQI